MAMQVKPTRSELLRLKSRIKLAKNGHSLLKKKRDGLIMEFFNILREARSLRGEMVAAYAEAIEKLNVARVRTSELYLQSLAYAIPKSPIVETQTKNVMGITIPKVTSSERVVKEFPERGYGIISGSAAIDQSVHGFEKVVELSVKVAEMEVSMKKILAEIEKTKRRVNALEFAVLPELREARDFIELRLEEIERDRIAGMKHIKKKA